MLKLNVYTVGKVDEAALKKLKVILTKEFPIKEIIFSGEVGNFPSDSSKSYEQLSFMAQHFITAMSLSGGNPLLLISIQHPPKYRTGGPELFLDVRLKEGFYGGEGARDYGAYVIFKECTDYVLLVIVHEVAHIFGLSHCDDKSCIMWGPAKGEPSAPESAFSHFCVEHRKKLKALK